jgi:hypothetical protein
MLPDQYYDEVIAQDVWEHFEREKTQPALAEWARLLSNSGFLWVRVPSMLHLADMLVAAEQQGPENVRRVLHLMFGTQAYLGDYHLTGFTPSVLINLFSSVGLVITEVHLLHGWLYEITARRSGIPACTWPAAHISKAHQAVTGLSASCKQLRAECEQLRAEIAALRGSTSWRITAPFRRIIATMKIGGS